MRHAISALFSKKQDEVKIQAVKALNNIDIVLNEGDRLGLLGGNGAGKSSLLRLLAGIYAPTSGKVIATGKISTLFDLWCGMDEAANAIENIRILSATLGYTPEQEQTIRDEIAEFSELGDALYRPVQTYSAGMRVRFVFTVVTAFFSDILLIDEIVGVGDKAFMDKARMRLKDNANSSKILVLASHSDALLSEFCNLGAVMREGSILFYGPIQEAVSYYSHHYLDLKAG